MLSKKQQFSILDNEPGWEYPKPIDGKKEAIKEGREVFGRAKERGYLPKHHSKDKQQLKDVGWISNKKQAKQGKGGGVFYPELLQIAREYGFDDVFEIIDIKSESIREGKDIFKRSKERGHLPKNNSKNKQEKRDASWIQTKKQSKLGNGRRRWYPELLEIAKKYGFPDAFEIINLEAESIKQCKEIFNRSKERGTLPRQHSKDALEQRDATWLSNIKNQKMDLDIMYGGLIFYRLQKSMVFGKLLKRLILSPNLLKNVKKYLRGL